MKRLFLTIAIALLLTCTSSAQKQDSLDVGRTDVFIVYGGEQGYVGTSRGINYIIDADSLEVDTEYDMVYRILSRRERVLVVQLIKAEHSALENKKRRAKLDKILY